jgi:hypothetical protein
MARASDVSLVTKWEWRIFERALSVDPSVIESVRVGEAWVSDETYLLSPSLTCSVRIAQGHVEIAHRDEVNAAGLERWRPVLTQPLPIERATLAEVCRALDVPPPERVLARYELGDLFRHVVAPDRQLVAVQVLALRTRLEVLGCLGEFVALRVRGQRFESLSFEDAHAGLVQAAVRQLGLDGRASTNFLQGLKRILGGGHVS